MYTLIQHDDRDLETYPHRNDLLPEVYSVGHGLFHRAVMGGPRPDGVPHVFEVCYLDQGSAEWWMDGDLQDIGAGHLFINRPEEWHGGRNAMLHPCSVFWVQVTLDPSQPLPGMTPKVAAQIGHDFEQFTHRFFPAGPGVKGHFENLLAEYRQPGPYSTVIARSALHGLLVQTLRDQARFAQETARPKSAGVQKVIDWIEGHIADSIPVEELAEMAGVSTGYFHRLFLGEVGYSPNEYRLRRRVVRAKQLLRSGERSITDIAHAVGFSSSQYFATVFKKVAGITPSRYQAMLGEQ